MDRVRQRLDGRDDDRVAGVDAERVHVLHRTDRDAGVVRVAHHLVFDLLPADQALLDHDLVDRTEAQAGANALPIGLGRVHYAAARATEREGGADDRGQPDLLQRDFGGRVLDLVRLPLDNPARSIRLAQPVEQVAEQLAILGHLDGGQRRADQPDVVLVEDPGPSQRHGQVQAGLAAEPGEEPFRMLFGNDLLDGLDRERLEVDGVRDLGVGHDRGRVGVDQDRANALGPEGAAGLRPGVVELGRLADHHRPGADDERRLRLRPLGSGRQRELGCRGQCQIGGLRQERHRPRWLGGSAYGCSSGLLSGLSGPGVSPREPTCRPHGTGVEGWPKDSRTGPIGRPARGRHPIRQREP